MPAEYDRRYSSLEKLDSLRRGSPYNNYPDFLFRLHLPLAAWLEMVESDSIHIPDGPWHVKDHPSRQSRRAQDAAVPLDQIVTPDQPMDPQRTAQWQQQGLLTTDLGLPLHPAAEIGLTTRFDDGGWLGMATGLGSQWYYGPINIGNLGLRRVTKDGVVEYAVVATMYGEQRNWSLPGGHAEAGRSAAEGALDEGHEEAGIPPELIQSLPPELLTLWVVTPALTGPNTLNSWLAEHFLMVDGSDISDLRKLELHTNDKQEIQEVAWWSEEQILAHKRFMPVHKKAVRAHAAHLTGRGVS